jgi:hypothetical protein
MMFALQWITTRVDFLSITHIELKFIETESERQLNAAACYLNTVQR